MAFSSCISQRRLIYLQDKDTDPAKLNKFIITDVEEEAIQPGDELYIRVSSSDERPTVFSTSQNYYMSDITLLSYTVDEYGFIKFPYIGGIKLINMSVRAASDTLETLLKKFMYLPTVNIKFVNKNVTIIGEIGRPGVYTFYDKRINILQAIGYASDITTFGDRKNVLLIREEKGIINKSYIDLTNNDILTSDLYIIKPNDIIYVQPLSRKKWGMETFPYSLLFTMISTVFMILTFMRYPTY